MDRVQYIIRFKAKLYLWWTFSLEPNSDYQRRYLYWVRDFAPKLVNVYADYLLSFSSSSAPMYIVRHNCPHVPTELVHSEVELGSRIVHLGGENRKTYSCRVAKGVSSFTRQMIFICLFSAVRCPAVLLLSLSPVAVKAGWLQCLFAP